MSAFGRKRHFTNAPESSRWLVRCWHWWTALGSHYDRVLSAKSSHRLYSFTQLKNAHLSFKNSLGLDDAGEKSSGRTID